MCLPGIDGICDYDSPYRKYLEEEQYVPDIDSQFVMYYQNNGKVYVETRTVFEDDKRSDVLAKALEFAKTHDVILMGEEPYMGYINPKTGESVETPDCGRYCKHYYEQPLQPYQNTFTAVETDELPF